MENRYQAENWMHYSVCYAQPFPGDMSGKFMMCPIALTFIELPMSGSRPLAD
ncbi:hypothetical protein GXY_00713 [Novacetimonas hansenii ATCC 23769]|uniref:Uncharacterized protein n=1 Tax=Novacetimonas hansenii ATCC 23769 TaxID=714995 RepID=D5QAM3_NOVHA|nr:hypothetical protein GXY_00713 [Novacetimonas hansenii ATCC 23769]